MKKNIQLFFGALLAMIAISSCEDDRPLPTLSSDPETFVEPALNNAATGTVVLNFEDADEVFEVLEWEPADFGVNLPVRYTVQADVVNATRQDDGDFSNAVNLVSNIAETTATLTVRQINDAALLLGMEPFVASNMQIRIVGTIVGIDADPIYSDVIVRTITPYVTSFEPIYMVGQAVGGWDFARAVEVYGTAPNQYSVIAYFSNAGDANFRFLSALDWGGATSYNYPYFTSVANVFVNANDGDSNFKFVGTSGYYRISVNLNTKAVTMQALEDRPHMWLIGDGTAAGWNFGTAIDMTWVKDGLFEATTQFYSSGDKQFRMLSILDWGGAFNYNYAYFENEEYEIPDLFSNAGGGDQNIKYTGEEGATWKLVIDMNNKTVTLAEPGTAGPPKYLVGDGTGAGWAWSNPVELVQVQAGIYEGTTAFNTAGAFRVFSTNGDWGSGKNYPTYINEGYTITNLFTNANDGDSNFKFTGTNGTYTFRLDDNAKTITLLSN